jgi:hypothetical protein
MGLHALLTGIVLLLLMEFISCEFLLALIYSGMRILQHRLFPIARLLLLLLLHYIESIFYASQVLTLSIKQSLHHKRNINENLRN